MDDQLYAHTEQYGGARLQWTNHVDAAGSRIEWRITTDSSGWVCSYGAVCNQGIRCGSRAIASAGEEKALLAELRASISCGAAAGQSEKSRAA
ncbi:hypothetical protein GT347_00165 [Xylophilus rhododendri]|uniref:Uncharacterized protein n=1 Tax=Xylophilus rhododendri TaxID=2697032 RepID=A0A857J0R6_9BURK|nr:hypothetical protein [Xylophilus rhododendri]QHI96548.1 hypothetical protein GT347_00165 [Xylophilus rhododendri]